MTRTLVAALAVLTFAVMGQNNVWAQTGTGSGDTYGSSSSGSTGSTSGAGMSGSSGTTTDPSGTTTDPSTTPSTTSTTSTTTSTSHSSMPATAGPWPTLLLMGFGALSGGTMLKRARR